jgi:23S rRNA-/tRNA-specific pseudouridylate synthase
MTTGALVIARAPQHARELSQQFASHTVSKSYLALVRAGSSFPQPGSQGVVDDALWVEDGHVSVAREHARTRGSGRAGGVRAAQTEWEVLAKSVSVASKSAVQVN